MQLCHEALGRAEVGVLFCFLFVVVVVVVVVVFVLLWCFFITIFQKASVGRISLLCRQFWRDSHFLVDYIQLRTRTVLPRNPRLVLILMEKRINCYSPANLNPQNLFFIKISP